jgi:hypothetical protein
VTSEQTFQPDKFRTSMPDIDLTEVAIQSLPGKTRARSN